MTYLVTGHFKFTSDGMARAQELMASIQQLGRTEPGMLRYSFYPDPNIEHGYFPVSYTHLTLPTICSV